MRKIAVKILTILLVVSAAILVLSGCASLDVQLDRDGSGTATLTLSKEEGVTKESIESELNEIFEGAAKLSQGRDVLKLKSVKESADGFSVKISFRRIRYIEGIGQYNFMSFSDFIKEMNKTSLVSNWEKGKYKNIQNYNEFIYNFNNQADESRAFSPVTADGEKLTAKEFTAQDSPYAANDKGMIFTYYIVGFSNLESVTFRFNGKIGVVGGKNVELVGDNARQGDARAVRRQRDGDPRGGRPRRRGAQRRLLYGLRVLRRKRQSHADFVPFGRRSVAGGAHRGRHLARLVQKIWRGARCRFIRKNYGLYLMMLPALVMLIIFSYAPMTGIVLAFKDFSIDDGIFGSEWAGMLGFKNFYDVLTTPGTSFGMLARNTVILAGLKFIFGFLCAILLAILFSYLKNNWFKKSVQTISYFPYFLSWVVVSGIAYLFLAADGGILNQLIALFGGDAVQWYSEPQYWRAILTFTSIWKTVGYSTIVYLAAMTAVDPALYEAATIDGAGRVNQLWHITLPGLFPVIGIQLIFSLGNLVRDDFDQIYTMTGGGNSYLIETTEVIGTVVFKAIGTVSAYATATAMGLMQSVVSLALVLSGNIIVKKMGMQGMF